MTEYFDPANFNPKSNPDWQNYKQYAAHNTSAINNLPFVYGHWPQYQTMQTFPYSNNPDALAPGQVFNQQYRSGSPGGGGTGVSPLQSLLGLLQQQGVGGNSLLQGGDMSGIGRGGSSS